MLTIRQFGDPLLRKKTRKLSKAEIQSTEIQSLVSEMRSTLLKKKLGVALAAPQVGKSIALFVIAVRPLKHRPNVKPFDLVVINPKITKFIGESVPAWEGCISSGSGQAGLFAKASRYEALEATFLDESGVKHSQRFDGLIAQIIQHETDHLNGVLFVDRVKDPKTYMTMNEYKKRVTRA